ncbi:heavy-metal-associated domain-containing protein [Seohaeicola saemankumensis]|nr:heavy-metal-associated domain-containing protein [Seohaeicola saemankumensis]MCA0871642.1 heavy-metal-associated domain-containing protein [Seohaeicola saemankumensis]
MTRFTVPDMSCGHCTAAIEKEIKSADSAAQVACDLGDHSVSVTSTLDSAALIAAIKQAGYTATPA